MGDPAAAEASYGEALGLARQHGAKLWELCTAMSLARLWRGQGRCAVAPVYGWFTEGFGTPVLQEAKALLDDLADGPASSASGVSAVAGAAGD
jgi:predicted ATPase